MTTSPATSNTYSGNGHAHSNATTAPRRATTATLMLEDGTASIGVSFGAEVSVAGELVFSTGMVGYPESLTDPSFSGQILLLTYPLIGNYGVPSMDDKDQWGLERHFESKRIHALAVVVANYTDRHSHFQSVQSLSQWLIKQGVPGIYGVDTRALTQRIRDNGSMLAKIVVGNEDTEFDDPNRSADLLSRVCVPSPVVFGNAQARYNVIAVDCGIKNNIIRSLVRRDVRLTVVPYNFDFAGALLAADSPYDGLFLSNGPGDPDLCAQAPIANMRRLLDEPTFHKPVFCICLGNQILAKAAGGRTYKLKYGNRGQNQPCIDTVTRRCYITSQNHGYAVDTSTLPAQWEPYFVNANDGSNEGVRHTTKPFFSVQFHPEATPGPLDTDWLFDVFVYMLSEHKSACVGGSAPPVHEVIEAAARGQLRDGVLPLLATGSLAGALHAHRPVPKTTNVADVLHALIDTSTPPPPEQATATMPQQLTAVELPTQPSQQHITPQQPLCTGPSTPRVAFSHRVTFRKVLILGSGALQIGQAGEFDYSGSQCIKALKEEGIETILINPNIATCQTSAGMATRVYFVPVTPATVTDIIEQERPDGVALSFGGQTALNCGVAHQVTAVLDRLGVAVLGTPVKTIVDTEDRELFNTRLREIGESIAPGVAACNTDEALAAANMIGYPVIIRLAFTLGGLGSGFVHNDVEMREFCAKAFAYAPQLLVEKSLKGWKELEYEVVRDAADNTIVVCNMENFDPMGVHTGESIVIAPSQTLTNYEYHLLRTAAIKIIRHLGVVGECNIQFALDPHSDRYFVIEVNARLSRSSALASKATGYPLAFVAAKLALGYTLPQVANRITRVTQSCFEPSLDYCVVKIPLWDLKKFTRVSRRIGSAMKSVGEVMSIGRSFEEALQKAIRQVYLFTVDGFEAAEASHWRDVAALEEELREPTDMRLFGIANALERNSLSVERMYELSRIDRWFLYKLEDIVLHARSIASYKSLAAVPPTEVRRSKALGFSDARLAHLLNTSEDDIRSYRRRKGILPAVKQIDTLAAEFPAQTNYLYMTYNGRTNDVPFVDHGVMVLGGGAYRIGSSIEFDWCAVSAVRCLRSKEVQRPTVMVNFNPETVSTDYDESDRLYFEELSLERVRDIYEREQCSGVVVSVGGQIPNNLAIPLHTAGLALLGTSATSIDCAEDRHKFGALVDSLGIRQPQWSAVTNIDAAKQFCRQVGYPTLIRPSYVLSGAAMRVIWNEDSLEHFLAEAAKVSKKHPVVISKFYQQCKEIELDAVAQPDGTLLVHAISEHVENAGVHSGDATVVFPAQSLSLSVLRQVRAVGQKLAAALKICGPFNVQFLLEPTSEELLVIECNLRASRSFPFVSKVLGVDFIAEAVRAMLNRESNAPATSLLQVGRRAGISASELNYVAVKCPMFSFTRLAGADPITGVEMASTGEVACFGTTTAGAFIKGAVSTLMPKPLADGAGVYVGCVAPQAYREIGSIVSTLLAAGYRLFVSPEVFAVLNVTSSGNGNVKVADWPHAKQPLHVDALELIRERTVALSIIITHDDESSVPAGPYTLRRNSVDFAIPLVTNAQVALLLAQALQRRLHVKPASSPWQSYVF